MSSGSFGYAWVAPRDRPVHSGLCVFFPGVPSGIRVHSGFCGFTPARLSVVGFIRPRLGYLGCA